MRTLASSVRYGEDGTKSVVDGLNFMNFDAVRRRIIVGFIALFCALAGTTVAARTRPVALADAKVGQFVDLTPEFVSFAQAHGASTDAELIAAFHARFDRLLPGFYDGRGDRQARFDSRIVQEMRALAVDSANIGKVGVSFAKQLRIGEKRFRRAFPDYKPAVPIYLTHSIRMMDGGTRKLADRFVLIFGADVIAREHDASTMGPFFVHELFHVYHAAAFDPSCEQLWCALWTEGLATYAAAELTPGATDRQLLLDLPQMIRSEVEPRLGEAMCRIRANFDSAEEAPNGEAFLGRPSAGPFPPRYGYFVGYRLAQDLGQIIPLAKLAKMPAAEVKPLLIAAMDKYGCGQTTSKSPVS